MPRVHRVVVRQLPDVREPAACSRGSIDDDEQPAEPAAEQDEEREAPERGAIAAAECTAHPRERGTEVGICRSPRRPTTEHGHGSDGESGANQQRWGAEAK